MKFVKLFFEAYLMFKHIITSLVILSFSVIISLLLVCRIDIRYIIIISIVNLAEILFIIIVFFIPHHKHLFFESECQNEEKNICPNDQGEAR